MTKDCSSKRNEFILCIAQVLTYKTICGGGDETNAHFNKDLLLISYRELHKNDMKKRQRTQPTNKNMRYLLRYK